MPVIGRRNYPSEGTVITQQIGVTRLSTIEIHHIKMQVKKFFDNKNSRQLSEMPPRAPQKYYRPLPMEEEVNSYRQVRSKVFIGSICKSVGKAIRKIFSRSKVIPVKLEPASDSAKLENSAKCGMDQNLPINRILYERTVIDFMISTYNMMNGQVSSLFMEELDNRIRSYDWLVPRPVYYHLSTKGAPPTTKLEDLNVTNKIQPRNTVKMENLEKGIFHTIVYESITNQPTRSAGR